MPSSDGLVWNMAKNLGDPSSATGDKQTGTTQFVFFAIDKKHFFYQMAPENSIKIEKATSRQKVLHQGRKRHQVMQHESRKCKIKVENVIRVESTTSRQKVQHRGRKCNIMVKCSLKKCVKCHQGRECMIKVSNSIVLGNVVTELEQATKVEVLLRYKTSLR